MRSRLARPPPLLLIIDSRVVATPIGSVSVVVVGRRVAVGSAAIRRTPVPAPAVFAAEPATKDTEEKEYHGDHDPSNGGTGVVVVDIAFGEGVCCCEEGGCGAVGEGSEGNVQ